MICPGVPIAPEWDAAIAFLGRVVIPIAGVIEAGMIESGGGKSAR